MKDYIELRSYKDLKGSTFKTYHYASGWVYGYQKGQRLFKVDSVYFEEFIANRGDIRVGLTRAQRAEKVGQLSLGIPKAPE